MLGCSELDMGVSNASMETMKSDDCKEMFKKDRDANDMLAVIQEEARFSHKDGWKFINTFTQLISRLCQANQLYPRTKEWEELSGVI